MLRHQNMKTRVIIFSILIGGIILSQFSSCKKDRLLTEGGFVSFSTDTLYFDTVFTAVGSVTKEFKIYNRNDRPIKINNIRLENGSASFFRLNVDGIATKNISDVEVAANDSVYVFAAVTVDPNAATNPFVINDKVLVQLNENDFEVPLQAYGQNAHVIRDSVLSINTTWSNDLPYVIINSAFIDSGYTLTIQKGCRIYMHANSKLFVGGTLNCFGTKEDSIIFQGDRLDRNYFGQDFPGEWRGLHFLRSGRMSSLNYTVIKNGGATDAAVYVEPPWVPFVANKYMLEMNKCKVENSLGFGILAFNTKINLNNCLVHTCGQQNFSAIEGGEYRINYCTFATYGGSGITHVNQPVMALWNYRSISETSYVGADLFVEIANSIIYGSQETELAFLNKGTGNFDVKLINCLVRRKDPIPASIVNVNMILNRDPLFNDRAAWDYSLESGSPAKGAASANGFFIDDICDVPRSATPTMGCYE